jgi:ribulose-5-phosphate 4-epimerase/fuculose-1-phosphate aldolase
MEYNGIVRTRDEGTRLVESLGNNKVLMLAQHGVIVVGDSVADAYDNLYYVERAARTMILAYSTG